MSDTAYIQYFGEINKFGAGMLMQYSALRIKDNCKNLHISISSGGGCNMSALTAYNFLKYLPCQVTTHNLAYCDSAANILFLAGSTRTASPLSRFLIHRSTRKFHKEANLDSLELLELYKNLSQDEFIASQIFKEVTGVDENEIRRLMFQGSVLTPEEAKSIGAVTEIAPFLPVSGEEIFFVPTEPIK